MTPIHGAGGVLFNSARDKVLLIMENESNSPTGRVAGQFSIPMGHVNEGEDFSRTAEREFEEETGFRVEAIELIGVFEVPNIQGILHAYRMQNHGRFIRSTECLAPRWVPIQELPLLERQGRLRAPTRQVVEAALMMLPSTSVRPRPP